ncbi:hypothetical protein GCM10027155_08310 [Acinetobacter apis]|uniref:Uncharacterized protein n=1 Tax=Acinetobacter apis TaxID=1229165 RepID=A0A217EFD5_9GAMM|nr:hypothetical protein [Acinetobacter apis]SNQ28910.1 hypothetical protein SAMN05444584_0841 [Acinetobacter apis]
MSNEQRPKTKKPWIVFFLALLVPIGLVLMLFFAASKDVQTKKKYAEQRAEYAEQHKKDDQALASDPEATVSSHSR